MATVRKYTAARYAEIARDAAAIIGQARRERAEAIFYENVCRQASIRIHAARLALAAEVKPVGRCMVDGEPLKASHHVTPRSGSVMPGPVVSLGTCPLCGTREVKLTVKGFLTAHVVRGEPMGKAPGLSERSIEPTDTGARVGDPYAGDKRRGTEIDGAFVRGTVTVKGDDGEMEEVPATSENLRLAASQIRKRADGKRKRADSARAAGDKGKALGNADAASKLHAEAAKLVRQAHAQEVGTGAFAGKYVRGQRDHGRSDGAALAGANLPPVQPTSGYIAKAGTGSLPVGRTMPDKGALGKSVTVHDREVKLCADMDCDHYVGNMPEDSDVRALVTWREFKALSRSQQNKVWGRIRKAKDAAKRARAYAKRKGGALSGTGGASTRDVTDGDVKLARIMSQRPDGREVREYLPKGK